MVALGAMDNRVEVLQLDIIQMTVLMRAEAMSIDVLITLLN